MQYIVDYERVNAKCKENCTQMNSIVFTLNIRTLHVQYTLRAKAQRSTTTTTTKIQMGSLMASLYILLAVSSMQMMLFAAVAAS